MPAWVFEGDVALGQSATYLIKASFQSRGMQHPQCDEDRELTRRQQATV